MYLVDTCVLSARAPLKGTPPPGVMEWMDQASPNLFLSVITAAEVTSGIAKARREGAIRRAEALSQWWQAIEHFYAARILLIDLPVAHAAGRLADLARSLGHAPGFADIAIAATAQVHGLVILTRNVKHFRSLHVPVANPFERLPRLP